MKEFDWFKAIGFGILIWGIGGIALWALTATTLSAGWIHGIVAVVIGVSAYVFAINAKPENLGQGLGYGAAFVAIGMALDALITHLFDAHMFAIWQYYLGYALTLIAPMFRVELPGKRILTS